MPHAGPFGVPPQLPGCCTVAARCGEWTAPPPPRRLLVKPWHQQLPLGSCAVRINESVGCSLWSKRTCKPHIHDGPRAIYAGHGGRGLVWPPVQAPRPPRAPLAPPSPSWGPLPAAGSDCSTCEPLAARGGACAAMDAGWAPAVDGRAPLAVRQPQLRHLSPRLPLPTPLSRPWPATQPAPPPPAQAAAQASPQLPQEAPHIPRPFLPEAGACLFALLIQVTIWCSTAFSGLPVRGHLHQALICAGFCFCYWIARHARYTQSRFWQRHRWAGGAGVSGHVKSACHCASCAPACHCATNCATSTPLWSVPRCGRPAWPLALPPAHPD